MGNARITVEHVRTYGTSPGLNRFNLVSTASRSDLLMKTLSVHRSLADVSVPNNYKPMVMTFDISTALKYRKTHESPDIAIP